MGIMDWLQNPQNQAAILGFTQAASQAAMPTRVPMGFGAALGQMGAGALQGKLQGYPDYQLKQQEIQKGQIGLQQQQALRQLFAGGQPQQAGQGAGSPSVPMGYPPMGGQPQTAISPVPGANSAPVTSAPLPPIGSAASPPQAQAMDANADPLASYFPKGTSQAQIQAAKMRGLLEGPKGFSEALAKIWEPYTLARPGAVRAVGGETIQTAPQVNDPNKAINPLTGEVNQPYIDAETKLRTAGQLLSPEAEAQRIRINQTEANNRAAATNTPLTTSPQDRAAAAAQAATGQPLNQIVPGYGKNANAQRQQVRNDAIAKIIQDNPGMSASDAGVELANRTIEFQSGKKTSGQLTQMLGATKQGVAQLDFNISKAKEEMAKLPSSNLSPILNAIARGEEKWTGNPAYSSLFYYMHATAVESARILSGGQASTAQLHQGAMEEAAKWASVNMTPASFDAVAGAMQEEGANRVETYQNALKSQRVGNASSAGQTAPQQGGKPPLVTKAAGGSSPYKSADDVKGAFQAGKLTKEQATGILRMQFGMQ